MKLREGDTSGLALFAAELQAARAKAGLTQEDLAARMNYSPSLVAMIESMRRAPTRQFALACDTAFDSPGTFGRLQAHASTTPIPSWFRLYAEVEADATQLRSWQPSFVDGLLQTEEYAQAVLSRRPNIHPEEADELVAGRMGRQAVLAGDDPPLMWAVIDEGALHRQVGSPKVMRDQLFHLAAMSARPNINVQVVPYSAGGHSALLGAFNIVDGANSSQVGYLETALDGYIVESPAVVGKLAIAFDFVRSEALSRSASLDFIRQLITED